VKEKAPRAVLHATNLRPMLYSQREEPCGPRVRASGKEHHQTTRDVPKKKYIVSKRSFYSNFFQVVLTLLTISKLFMEKRAIII